MIGRASLKGTVRLKIAFLDWVDDSSRLKPVLHPFYFFRFNDQTTLLISSRYEENTCILQATLRLFKFIQVKNATYAVKKTIFYCVKKCWYRGGGLSFTTENISERFLNISWLFSEVYQHLSINLTDLCFSSFSDFWCLTWVLVAYGKFHYL